MIDVKGAVRSAKHYAGEVLEQPAATVEEIEREGYKARDVWRITLGFPNQSLAGTFGSSRDYKSFLVDAETGEILAVKIRELTAP